MDTVYAICGEYEIPNRKGKGFSLLRVVENGMARPGAISSFGGTSNSSPM